MSLVVLYWIIAVILVLLGAIGTFLPLLPGPPLVLVGFIVAAWIDNFEKVGFTTLIVLGVLTALCVGLDFVASMLGAKRVGASKYALMGAALGTIVGLFFALPGVILGPFVGAVLGEYYHCRDVNRATRSGLGTWLGMILGAAAKAGIVVVMLLVFAYSYIHA